MLNILCTDKGREALRNVLSLGLYKSIIVGKFRASSTFIGAGSTDADKRSNFQTSVLTPAKYINSIVPDGDSVSYFCQLYPPSETLNPMSAVALYFKLLTPVEEEYYETHPTLNPFDSIDTTSADNIFGLCWFDSLAEAIPINIMQQMIPKFTFSNGDVAGAFYQFQPNWETDDDQSTAILAMTSDTGYQFLKFAREMAKLNKEIINIKNKLGM